MSAAELRVQEGFDATAWGRLATRGLVTSPQWVAAMRTRVPGDLFTLVAEEPEGPRAAALVAWIEDPDAYEAYNAGAILFRGDPVFETDPSAAAERQCLERWQPSSYPQAVVVVPGYDVGVVSAHDAPPPAGFLAGVVDWARERGAALAAFLFAEAGGPIDTALAGLGGQRFPLTARCGLEVTWRDFPEYLRQFPSRRGREIRRERRRLAERGIAVTPRLLPEVAESLVELRCEALRSHGHAADADGERDRLDRLRAALGDDLVAFVAGRDEAVEAFMLFARHDDAWHALTTGQRAASEQPFLHFEVGYYAPAEAAPGAGVTRIDYGISHTETKVRRGCRREPLVGHALAFRPQLSEPVEVAAALLSRGWPHPEPYREVGLP